MTTRIHSFAAFALFAVLPFCDATAADPVAERQYEWVEVTAKADFAPRDGAGALVFKNQMWFLGGWNPGDKTHFPLICNNEVWSSTDGAQWTLRKPNTFLTRDFDPKSDWEGRHTAGYAVHDGKMWIIGGDANQGHYQNDVWSSADGVKWDLVTDDIPWAPRALHYTAAFNDKLWVIGGQTMPAFGGGEERFYRDVWTSIDGKTWTELKPVEPYWSPRGMIGGSAILNDRLWVLGGGTYDTPTTPKRNFYNDIWSTADGIHWKLHTADAGWAPRQYHDVATFDGQLWVLEGYEGVGNRKDVWRSADGANWHELPNTPWAPRHASSIYVYNDALWVVAGNNMTSDVWKLVRTDVIVLKEGMKLTEAAGQLERRGILVRPDDRAVEFAKGYTGYVATADNWRAALMLDVFVATGEVRSMYWYENYEDDAGRKLDGRPDYTDAKIVTVNDLLRHDVMTRDDRPSIRK